MPTFRIQNTNDREREIYWVQADSATDARRLIALNCPKVKQLMDAADLECIAEEKPLKVPPQGFIYRRLFGPIAIIKR